MREIKTSEIQKELTNLTQTKTEDMIWCVYDRPIAFKSKENDVNEAYCIQNNVTIIETGNMGGTMVANAGDIGVAIIKKEGWSVGNDALHFICEKLKPKIPTIRTDNNDLITGENFKMGSFASFNVGDKVIYTIIDININPDITHIVNICSKPMNKIPKGLNDFGVTRDEVIQFLEDFGEKYGI